MENKEFEFLKGKTLLLASASPRRRELLGNLGIPVELATLHDVDESYPDTLALEDVAPYVSKKKAAAYKSEFADGQVLVAADTVVISDGKVLGKPHSEDEARRMLRQLSGSTHRVVTGVTLVSGSNTLTFAEHTDVTFDELTDDEIDYYVDRFRPLDKAGAYGIQEWIGYIGISGISGDYYNVVGLPLRSLYRHLRALLA